MSAREKERQKWAGGAEAQRTSSNHLNRLRPWHYSHLPPPLLTLITSPAFALGSDANSATARAYGVSAMPTFIFLKNKSVLETVRGADKNKLTAAVEKHSVGSTASAAAFSGQGNTLGGSGSGSGGANVSSSSASSRRPFSSASPAASPAAASPLQALSGIGRDNLLPLLVLAAYLAYVLLG